MKVRTSLLSLGIASVGILCAGCEPSVPVNPKPADGSNPYVSGTPLERIKNIEANPELSQEEKARRIKVIKERNHIP